MRIRAFNPLRPSPELASRIASLPYDVVSRVEAQGLAAGNPLSMLHVVRAEIDLPADTNPYSEAVYARAKENLDRLTAEGAMIREAEPCLYLYQQQMNDHVQTGLVTLCHVDDYDKGLIKRHEKTRPDKENDRTRLTDDLSANTGPVFLTYRDLEPVNRAIETATTETPLYDFRAEDGIRHTVWRVVGGEALIKTFGDAPPSMWPTVIIALPVPPGLPGKGLGQIRITTAMRITIGFLRFCFPNQSSKYCRTTASLQTSTDIQPRPSWRLSARSTV